MGHQAHHQDVEDAARNCSRYGHHVQPRHHMVDIGSTGKCFCKEGPEKRCSPMGKPSQHVWEQVAHLSQGRPCHQKETGYQSRMQEGSPLFAVSIGYSSESAPLPGGGGSPSLVAQPLYAKEESNASVLPGNGGNFCLLLASYPIGSLHGDRPMWLHFRHRRV